MEKKRLGILSAQEAQQSEKTVFLVLPAKRTVVPALMLAAAMTAVLLTLRAQADLGFWLANSIQMLYAIGVMLWYKTQGGFTVKPVRGVMLAAELAVIPALTAAAYLLSLPATGSLIVAVIIGLLVVLTAEQVYLFWRNRQALPVNVMVNLLGVMASLVVLKSNFHVLSETASEAVVRMLLSSGITYAVAMLLTAVIGAGLKKQKKFAEESK